MRQQSNWPFFGPQQEKKNKFISISKPTARAATKKHEEGNKKKPDKNANYYVDLRRTTITIIK